MQPPLPEVPKTAPKSQAKEPFLGLNVAFGVCAFSTLCTLVLGCFFPAPDVDLSILTLQIISFVVAVLSLLIDFYLWRGYNWARWLTIVGGAIALYDLYSPSDPLSTLVQIERVFSMLNSLWWLGLSLWLLLPGVAKHFKTTSGNTSTEINAG